MKVQPRKLVVDARIVPSLPIIFAQINKVINDPVSTTTTIADVVSNDTGLSARLLRMANSAFFSFPSRVDTISEAAIVIGFEQIRDLALATTVIEVFRGVPKRLVDMKSFWHHSVACGIAARVVAIDRREANVERHFVAGLLHDIGRLIMFLKTPDEAAVALRRSKTRGELLYQAEREVFGFDHGEVGGELLRHWKLPVTLIEPVAFHHRPLEARQAPVEAAIVHLADIIANAMQLGSSGERWVPPLVSEAWDRLGLTTSVLEPTLREVERQFDDTIEIFLEPVSRIVE